MAQKTESKKPSPTRAKSFLERLQEQEMTRERSPEVVLATMNPELRKLYEQLQERYLQDHQLTLQRRYELGEMVKPVDEDETAGGSRFGQKPLKRLQTALNWDDTSLLLSVRFVRVYTREEVEHLSQMRRANGLPITWSHIRLLIPVGDTFEREKLLGLVVEHSWTAKELVQHMMQAHVKKPTNRGRPLKAPKDLGSCIRQQTEFSDKFLERSEQAWNGEHSLEHLSLVQSPAERTEEMLQALKENWEKAERAAQEMARRASEARKVYERYRQFMEKLDKHDAKGGSSTSGEPLPGGDSASVAELAERDADCLPAQGEDDVIPTVSDPGDNHSFESVGGDAAHPFTLEITDEAFAEDEIEDDIDDALEEPAHQDDRCLALSV